MMNAVATAQYFKSCPSGEGFVQTKALSIDDDTTVAEVLRWAHEPDNKYNALMRVEVFDVGRKAVKDD